MIPLFTSDYSIGRSILKIKPPKEPSDEGPDDILSLAKAADLKEVYLVEDSMIGFLEAHKAFSGEKIAMRFGVRFNICNDISNNDGKNVYKIILFALNDNGCKQLYRIFSDCNTRFGGFLDYSHLAQLDYNNLFILHPFYDSYLFHNTFHFKNCIFKTIRHDREAYSIENNDHPFDAIMGLNLGLNSMIRQIIETKTILYKNRADAEAYQVYRMSCNRAFGREQSLSAPNIEHFGSREFCFQSFMEQRNGKSS